MGICASLTRHPPDETKEDTVLVDREDSSLPERLQYLYRRASEGLNEKQKKMLHKVLWEHQEVFAKTSKCLGKTAVVEHEIDTGDHRPVKQAP